MTNLAVVVLLVSFFVLMALHIPVTFSLLLSTLASALVRGTKLTVMIRMMLDGVNNFSLLAIPFFILMGEIMSAGKISDKIIDLANLVVGRFRGGLAYVNVLDSTFFGGISGSAVADVSSLGSVVVPLMKNQGYDAEFSVGLTVTTACQGVLIPPSHNMVIYALAAGGGVTVASMFMAGAVPGLLLGACFMAYCFISSKKYNFPKGEKIGALDSVRWIKISRTPAGSVTGMIKDPATWVAWKTSVLTVTFGKCIGVVVNSILPMLTLVIIMGGVAAGIFTATESAAVACVYSFFLTYAILRSDKISHFPQVLKNSLKTLATVLTLIATAKAFAYMMVDLRVPSMITDALISVTDNRILLLLIINFLLLVLGCFMDMAPLIMIMTPILLPVVTGPVVQMSMVQFGVMLIMNLAIGLCTPPVGSALFVGCAVGKTNLEKTSRKMLGMFGTMIFALLIVTFVPSVSLWLPSMLKML